jgi:DNA adenine methylase
MNSTRYARPFLKWAGGKQGIADDLVRQFPGKFTTYYEPFLGGGSVLFALRPKRAVVGDCNGWLVDCYLAVRDDWERVADILDTLRNTKDDYLRIRSVRPETLDVSTRAAHLIYLNKTCFRGLFRVNRQGQFNVPYGKYDRRYYDRSELAAVAEAIKRYEFRQGDFERSAYGVKAGDFLYLDPPYYKLGGYSDFNRYTKDQFRESDHIRLAAFCREMDERGVLWAVSNSDTAFVRKLFAGYRTVEVVTLNDVTEVARQFLEEERQGGFRYSPWIDADTERPVYAIDQWQEGVGFGGANRLEARGRLNAFLCRISSSLVLEDVQQEITRQVHAAGE